MTQKIYENHTFFLYENIEDKEWENLNKAIQSSHGPGAVLPMEARVRIEEAVNTYLQAIKGYADARSARELRDTLISIRDAVTKFTDRLEKLTGEKFVGRQIGPHEKELEKLHENEKREAVAAIKSAENAELLSFAFWQITKEARDEFQEPFDLPEFCRNLDVIYAAADSLAGKYTKKTGRRADPFYPTLVSDLMDTYAIFFDNHLHTTKSYNFIYCASMIAKDHLEARGLLVEGVAVRGLSQTSVVDWIKTVRRERYEDA
ncbi:hypothetical protein D9623_00470 [Azospirillum brasilense]|jgi:hypothetical protein|uniref:Uncharacterized protein n=1 Tax=Azospirillum brasilense TaxID=192 RepID=A0A4D8QL67_AZOBR|nr:MULTISPECIES: hypothetical protein [Azospirillum]MDW7552771.1 hypothetical protein [Azospirillum brasilense]MDW7592037.1 hypothetical protein [Azospirillum brasilense]MDW7627686.1 hypothetical protein [Azospirillum brasilense]MDX5952845.1 hypothetical protein [Azospirillum brasilense]OPH15346.1 hypothetical protein FE89_11225 [Azospirillum brasilense]